MIGIGFPQAVIVAAVGVSSTVAAAIIGGIFLVLNTAVNSYLERRRSQKRRRDRRRNPRNYSGDRGKRK